jgi:hypothetical protein
MLVSASNLAVPVTNSLTTLLEILSLTGIHRIWIEIKPTVHDFNAFAVQGKFHPSGDYVTLANAAADFAVPSDPILKAIGTLVTLAADATGSLCLNTTALHSLRIQASSASATGTLVDIYANASS